MKKIESNSKETAKITDSLQPLNINEIEERLEVSSIAPHGGIVDSNLFDGDYCCQNKCSGNEIQIDDPIDTGEIGGGSTL